MTPTIYAGASGIFGHSNASALIEQDGVITFVGSDVDARRAAGEDSGFINLEGGYVIPGVVEAHTHLVLLGSSLTKAQLQGAVGMEQIRSLLLAHREQHPDSPRLLAAGWLARPDDPVAHRSLLDEWFPNIPVYIDANDLHETWVNSAALEEMGLDARTPNPPDGHLERDANGDLSGILRDGAAFKYAWTYLASVATEDEKHAALDAAFARYLATGVTTAVDLALSDHELSAFKRYLGG